MVIRHFCLNNSENIHYQFNYIKLEIGKNIFQLLTKRWYKL